MVIPVIIGIHLTALPIKKEGCKLGNKRAFRHTEQAGGEPKKRKDSAVVAKTLGICQAGEEVTSLKSRAKGDIL